MKKTLLTLLLITSTVKVSFSQKLFKKYENREDVSSLVFSKYMLKIMKGAAIYNEKTKDYADLIDNIKSVSIYTTNKKEVVTLFSEDVQETVEMDKLELVANVSEGNSKVTIYGKVVSENDDQIEEMVMFVNNKQPVKNVLALVLFIDGKIDLTKVTNLLVDLNIMGGEYLELTTPFYKD